jgi:CDP-glycerol glycerophosphotransferase
VAAARAALGLADGATAVLYAPTHREYEEGYVPKLDLAQLADALGPGFVLLARLHYFYDSDPLVRELHEAGRLLDVASHPSVEELCLAADVLLTDYSSIMFDYAILNRPIVIHAPDWELYRAARGVYFDLIAEPPGVVTRTDDELAEALLSGAAWSEETARRREAFRRRFCSLETGQAAEGVVRRVWFESPLGPGTER